MTATGESDGKSINKATKRVLEVLNEFIGAPSPLGASELSRRLNMTRNMVHRALVTLNEEGLLYKHQDTGRYVLSYNLATLQNTSRPAPDLRRIARPYLEEISERLGETVQLTVRSRDFQTVIDGIEGHGTVALRVKLGNVYPLHLSVGSRAILAACPDDEIDDYISRNQPLRGMTPTSMTDPEALWAEVRRIREEGFARSMGDFNPTTAGFAYAILDFDARPHGALVVGGPAQRLGEDWIDEARQTVEPIVNQFLTIAALYEAN
ncbi:MAG: IclR family transcriptional regulator [Roseitalea sp.]|jgi:DNA-binding IclR family transcriptional regulator|nr:IclR family transcriptional regulator [Roseitalea sp.]MBO6721361.1 IclR family transcriptional regulator [Roseitalea sp.]MBO6744546.1 IclR family transcriptional regulator [Roseitalea sp.]